MRATCSGSRPKGWPGSYGFYEAIDYTPARLPRGQTSAVVRSFMAHHQGMSLLALAHLLLDRPMQRRFEADPLFQATLLLLQERVPKAVAVLPHIARARRASARASARRKRRCASSRAPTRRVPEVQLLSNGRYHVMVTNAGGGYSRWRDLAVTRWREDATRDGWGTFCYLRDVASGDVLVDRASADAASRADRYEAIFSEGRAEFRRRDDGIDAHTEIAVSPEDDIELRRTRIANRSRVAHGHRAHELRGGRAGAAGGRRRASGVQQPVRADRDRPRASRRSCARAGRARRASRRRGCST